MRTTRKKSTLHLFLGFSVAGHTNTQFRSMFNKKINNLSFPPIHYAVSLYRKQTEGEEVCKPNVCFIRLHFGYYTCLYAKLKYDRQTKIIASCKLWINESSIFNKRTTPIVPYTFYTLSVCELLLFLLISFRILLSFHLIVHSLHYYYYYFYFFLVYQRKIFAFFMSVGKVVVVWALLLRAHLFNLPRFRAPKPQPYFTFCPSSEFNWKSMKFYCMY